MIGRHQPKVRMGDGQRVASGLTLVQQFGDAEIEQLGHPGVRHQDVRRLEIAVHDEVLMSVVHRGTNRLKELEPCNDVEMLRVAIGVNRNTVDVLHDDVCGTVRKRATIQEMRDVGMIELGEDLAFDLEPRLDAPRKRAAENHLDGHLLLELGIGALGQENLAHPAHAQRAQYAIGSDAISFHALKHAPRRR